MMKILLKFSKISCKLAIFLTSSAPCLWNWSHHAFTRRNLQLSRTCANLTGLEVSSGQGFSVSETFILKRTIRTLPSLSSWGGGGVSVPTPRRGTWWRAVDRSPERGHWSLLLDMSAGSDRDTGSPGHRRKIAPDGQRPREQAGRANRHSRGGTCTNILNLYCSTFTARINIV